MADTTPRKVKLYALAFYRSDLKPIVRKGKAKNGQYFLNLVLPDQGRVIGIVSDHSEQDCWSQYFLLKRQAREYALRQGWTFPEKEAI